MASLLYQTIEQISREKHIEPEIIIAAIEDAMVVAARKYYRTEEDLRSKFNPDSGQIDVFSVHMVVDEVADPLREVSLTEARKQNPDIEVGGEITAAKPTDVLGRISAQTAKQVILQKVREAERDSVYSEFHGRQGELVNCIVKRVEGQDYIVDMGKTEARLPKKEQSRIESFSVGDRVRRIIKGVERGGKNAGVVVSRAAGELVMRLFEQEVPEIYDNTVQIKACAREAGERTKIAVASRDRDVDSVGACVGMKGMRVQSIIRELRGEKIDIIEYSEDAVVFATHALSPAKVSRISIIDALERHMEVIVDDSQLSLAIGKKGQNVRLAAKLLQWKIDIKSEEEKRQEVESQMQAMSGGPATPIEQVSELGETILEKLIAAGITTVEALADMTPEQLEEVPGIGEKTVEKISVAVRHYFGQYEEGEERPEPTLVAVAEPEVSSMDKTPEAILAEEAGTGTAKEVSAFSTEDLADLEDRNSGIDAFSDADAREERIELDNDTVDTLVNDAQEVSDEGIDDGNDRG